MKWFWRCTIATAMANWQVDPVTQFATANWPQLAVASPRSILRTRERTRSSMNSVFEWRLIPTKISLTKALLLAAAFVAGIVLGWRARRGLPAMTASYLVAIAVTDPSSGRVWTAPTGSSHYDLLGDCGAASLAAETFLVVNSNEMMC